MTVKAAAQQHYMLCICTKIHAIAGTALTFHGAGGIIAIWIKPYFVLAAQAHHYILNLEKQCIKNDTPTAATVRVSCFRVVCIPPQ